MKYFLDTEFIEHDSGIQLVSIGIVDENGETFYAESSEIDSRLADTWVKANVLSKLHYWGHWPVADINIDQDTLTQFPFGRNQSGFYGSESQIKEALLAYFEDDLDPEFYAYFADYDWVVFCRIFGRMIELPPRFPKFCIDLKQMMWERGLTRDWKETACPDPEGEHNALVDALWNQRLYEAIRKVPSRDNLPF